MENIEKLNVLYEDNHIIVVVKPRFEWLLNSTITVANSTYKLPEYMPLFGKTII